MKNLNNSDLSELEVTCSQAVEITKRIREVIDSVLSDEKYLDDTPILADYERLTLQYINNLNKLLYGKE